MENPVAPTEEEEKEVAETLATLHKHPQVFLPCLYRSPLSYTKACALLGCSLAINEEEGPYCSLEHKKASMRMSQQKSAYHFFDGFRDVPHRDTTCAACVIQRSNGVDIGIPTLDNDNIFSTLPWAQQGVFQTDQEANRDWLFFHNPPAAFKCMDTGLYWKANKWKRLVFNGVNVDTTSLSLRIHGSKKEKGGDNWILYLFQLRNTNTSLYCLTFVKQKEPKVSKKDHNKKKKKHDGDDRNNNPEEEDKETSESAPNQEASTSSHKSTSSLGKTKISANTSSLKVLHHRDTELSMQDC